VLFPLLCGTKSDFLKEAMTFQEKLWQEGREGEERLMSVIVKQRKTGVGECYLETRGESPHLRG
jgi:hypothetical protein